MEVLKVSSKSKPNSVAGALANAFSDIMIDGEERTAIKLIVESRK